MADPKQVLHGRQRCRNLPFFLCRQNSIVTVLTHGKKPACKKHGFRALTHPIKPFVTATRHLELALAFIVCLSAVAVDVSLPAIPSIVGDLGAVSAQGQLVIASYLLGFACGQLPFGLFADRYGRLISLRVGLGLFVVASVVTVISPDITTVLIARFIQGVGGASAAVIARAIARDIAGGAELARLTALLVAALAIAMLIAPLIGSAVIYFANWRAVFAVSLAMGLVAAVLTITVIPETKATRISQTSFGRQLADSVMVFLRSGQSVWAAILVGCTFFAYMGIVAGIALVTVDAYGKSSTTVGLVFSGAVVFYLLASRVGAKVARSHSARVVLKYGIVAFAIAASTCALNLIFQPQSFWYFWFGLLPFFCGMGLVFPAATALALDPLPAVAGFAASVLGTFQILVSVLGAVLTGLYYDATNVSLLGVVTIGSTAACLVYLGGKSAASNSDN